MACTKKSTLVSLSEVGELGAGMCEHKCRRNAGSLNSPCTNGTALLRAGTARNDTQDRQHRVPGNLPVCLPRATYPLCPIQCQCHHMSNLCCHTWLGSEFLPPNAGVFGRNYLHKNETLNIPHTNGIALLLVEIG